MDQHDVGSRVQRLKAGPDRRLAGLAAEYRRTQGKPLCHLGKGLAIFMMNDRLDGRDIRMRREQDQTRPDHRLTADLPVLLR